VVEEDAARARALELAYSHLNRRDRTEAEMRRHLEVKDVGARAIDAAIDALTDSGYLDDARFARMFAEDKRELERWGDDRIRQRLLARGVNREVVESTLSSDDPQSELERAVDLLRRRFPTPPDDRRERDRALGVLIRKGYESELALDALRAHARGDADV
jgi:regulatory protein